MNKTRIVFAGEGGQGIQTIAKIFTAAALESKYEVSYIPSFGVEQRGTPSVAFITISSQALRYPKFELADYVLILQQRAVSSVSNYISPSTKVIFDSSTVNFKKLPKTSVHLFGVPATKYAIEKFNPKSFNILLLGAITKIIDIDPKKTWKAIEKVLGSKFKTDKIKEENKEAFLFVQSGVLWTEY